MNINNQSKKNRLSLVKSNLILGKDRQKNQGYSLPEVIAAMAIMTIVGAVTAPTIVYNDPVTEGVTQFKGILEVAQSRAVSTTSAVRIKPDENKPNEKLTTEISNIRSCQSTAELAQSATSTDTELILVSTDGLTALDKLIIGSDSDNNIVKATTPDENKIFLDSPLGTNQPKGSKVELSEKWELDSALLNDDLTFPKNAEISADITDWTICIDSSGIVHIYNDKEEEQPELVVTVTNALGGSEEEITLLKGGVIKTD